MVIDERITSENDLEHDLKSERSGESSSVKDFLAPHSNSNKYLSSSTCSSSGSPTPLKLKNENERRDRKKSTHSSSSSTNTKLKCNNCSFVSSNVEAMREHSIMHHQMQSQLKSTSQFATNPFFGFLPQFGLPQIANNTHRSSSSSNSSNGTTTNANDEQRMSNSSIAIQQHQQPFNILACQFCDHVSKNFFMANEHFLFHLDSKLNLPTNLFLENQIRQILNIPTTSQTVSSLNAAAAVAAAQRMSTMMPAFSAAQLQQAFNAQQTMANTANSQHTSDKEYIDIGDYEKFTAALQKASGR